MLKDKRVLIEKLFCIMGVMIILGVWGLKLYTVLIIDAPRELREATLVAFVQSFLEGENPYAISGLSKEIPVATSMYGFIIPLVLTPLCFLNSVVGALGTLQFCQVITLLVELVGVYYGYKIVYERTADKCCSVCAAILVYSCYWRYDACGGAYPDQWGISVSVFLAYLISVDSKKKYRPLLYTFIILVLFYIKAYFVFITFGILMYLWRQSKKDCIKLIVSGSVGGLFSFVIVNLVFPLYFSQIIPNGAGQTINGGVGYSLGQIYDLTKRFYAIPMFIVMISVIMLFYKWFVKYKRDNTKIGISLKNVTDSLIGCEVICILPFTIYIARNVGTNYTYYLQLWYIWVVMFALECLENSYKEKLNKLMYWGKLFLICGSIVWCIRFMVSQPLNRNQIDAWEETYAILEEYSSEGDILVSAHLSSWCIDNDILVAEYGQHEFNNEINLESYKEKKWVEKIFPLADDIIMKALEYNEKIRQDIQNNKYTCVALTTATNYGIDEEYLLQNGYCLLDEKDLATGRRIWNTKIYVIK